MKKKILIILIIVIVLAASLIVIKRKRDVASALRQVEQQNIEKAKEATKLKNEIGVDLKKAKAELYKISISKDFKEINEYVQTLKTIRDVKLALPKINSYPTVERAHVEGTNLFVDFKGGGGSGWSLWDAPGVN